MNTNSNNSKSVNDAVNSQRVGKNRSLCRLLCGV